MPNSALLEHHLAVPDEDTAAQAARAVEALERFLRQHLDVSASVSLAADDDDTTLESRAMHSGCWSTSWPRSPTSTPSPSLRFMLSSPLSRPPTCSMCRAPTWSSCSTSGGFRIAGSVTAPRPFSADLLDHKRRDDAERRAIADELTAEAQRLGIDY